MKITDQNPITLSFVIHPQAAVEIHVPPAPFGPLLPNSLTNKSEAIK